MTAVTADSPSAAYRPFADGWNFADIWEAHADRFPEAVALVHGDRRISWADFDTRADGVASALIAAGLERQDKVAQYLYNCPEYMESMYGLFKASLVPVNTNYRYTDDELLYLWDNADVAAVVFDASFTTNIERLRAKLPGVKLWLWVADAADGSGAPGDSRGADSAECPAWAMPYESAASARPGRVRPSWGRSGDDLYILYTGGTTGMPKGVMWRQDDIAMVLDAPSKNALPGAASAEALIERVPKTGIVSIPAAPLMHGTGAFGALTTLLLAGTVVTMEGRSFDPAALLDTIDREKVTSMNIVGDAFAKPIVRALTNEPARWSFASMRVMISSGVMWSAETKAALLSFNPRLIMVDTLGSSEAIGMASQVTDAKGGSSTGTASFRLNAQTRVLTEDGRDVEPGSGERGLVALRGRTPIGYYKDPEKSAKTFTVIDGVRYSIPGDYAEVELDGTLRLLGRGSQCINTGGEKVYPEEVEEALKRHAAIHDAAVVGLPDERFGEAIVALVEAQPGVAVGERPSDPEVIAFVREHLAAYKSPKRLVWIDSIGRAANGKVDYKALKERALAAG